MTQTTEITVPQYNAPLRNLDEALARAEAEKVIDSTTRKLVIEVITGIYSAITIQARKLLESLEFAERTLMLLCSRCQRFARGLCSGRTGWVVPEPGRCPHAEALDAIYDAVQNAVWDAMNDLVEWLRERW
ncbi:MAG: hypothetical protein ACTSX9_02530 [Candidatus Njordarchaeales archaeon]